MLILYTVGPSEPSVQVLPITVYNYQVREVLHKNFSQFGLLHRLHLGEGEEGTRGFTRLRLSEFVQISEFFQFYITDIVRHLSHFPKVSI